MKKAFLLICICLIYNLLAGQRTVTGVITDATNSQALIGANVQLITNKNIGTSTDLDGSFSLTIPDKDSILLISYTGYTAKEVNIKRQNNRSFTLSPSLTTLDEVIVVGYGSQVVSKVSGSVSRVDKGNIEGTPVTSLEGALQGRVAGVFINNKTGKLGTNINVRIRGASSINASNEPLYVVDGVVINTQDQLDKNHPRLNPLADIDFNDIASVDILKDAAAAAIYGSRASNGVIIITTKQGQQGQTRVGLDLSTGWSTPTRKRKWLNAQQYLELWDEAFANVAASDGTLFGMSGEDWKNSFIPEWNGGHDTNWEDLMYDPDAGIKQVLFNISGGSEKTSFYISGGYSDHNGIIILNSFKRLNGRINLTHKASSQLDFGVNTSFSRTNNRLLANDVDFANPGQMIAIPPVQPLYDPQDPDQLFEGSLYYHAKFEEENADYSAINLRSISNAFINWKPVPNLNLHSDFGMDLFIYDFQGYNGTGAARNTGEPRGRKGSLNNQALNYTTNHYATYNRFFGEHYLKATAGISYQQMNEKFLFLGGRNFPNDDFQNLTSAGEINNWREEESAFSILSYFSRLNYDFDGKLLLTLSGRIDGDSRFGADNRYGFFPAASAGYVLSKEPFFAQLQPFTYLKLRASWGLTGNTPIDRFASLGLFEGTGYAGISGIQQTQIANPDLSWEKTRQINLGLDFGLFNERLFGEINYYWKNTSDLLLEVNVAGSTGFRNQLQNVGELKNKGLELMLTSHNVTGKLNWTTNFNFSRNVNKVTNLNGLVIDEFLYRLTEGEPLGSFFYREFAGVDPDNGDPLYYLNTPLNDGQRDRNTTNDINQAERVVVGDPNPAFIYGFQNTFSWKGIELDVLFQGVYGNEVLNASGQWQLGGFPWFDNLDFRMLDRWQQAGDQTDIPQLRFLEEAPISSRFIQDASFLRLKNLSLSYQVPGRLIKKMGMQQLKLYVTGQNIWTITNFIGWDPEVTTDAVDSGRAGGIVSGIEFFSLPQAKSWLVGIKATF